MIEFFVEFIPVRMLSQTMEVPGTYFQEQNGNTVRLYMNADDDGSAPIIKYGGEDGSGGGDSVDEKLGELHDGAAMLG